MGDDSRFTMSCKNPCIFTDSYSQRLIGHPSVCDKSIRYVAEENILRSDKEPSEALLRIAGRHFKRWDAELNRFVSNKRDEYPDD